MPSACLVIGPAKQAGTRCEGVVLNTQYLREYLVFAEEPNYTAAANRLYMTRPTLVEHIRALEAELECRLVDSDRRNVWLTPEGKRFVRSARVVLDGWKEVRDEYRCMADNLLAVRIASTNLPWIEDPFYRARRTLQRQFPNARVELVLDDGPASSFAALEARANDIVVVGYKAYMPADRQPSFADASRCFPLSDEEVLLLVPEDSRLFGLERICLRDLDGIELMLPPDIFASWTRDNVAGWFERQGAHVTLDSRDFASHFEYFSYDFGRQIGIVPRTLVARFGLGSRESLRVAGIADVPLRTMFYAVARDSFLAKPRGRLLFDEMRRNAGGNEA